jgi:hypothetical protein
MMKFEINHRFTGAVLFSLECGSLKICVEAAVKADANLADADLARADLARADLAGANLARANLARADLADANLAGANLARANLARADLAGANLAGANLAGAYLAGANLARANGPLPATKDEAIANLDKVREIILDNAALLEMGHWHDAKSEWQKHSCAEEAVCGTTHCLAGWLQVCSTDKKVRKLDPFIAGCVSAPVAAKMFYKDNREVMDWLRDREYAK